MCGRRRLKSDGFDESNNRRAKLHSSLEGKICSLTLFQRSHPQEHDPVATFSDLVPRGKFLICPKLYVLSKFYAYEGGAHLSFQHVSLQARAILLGAVGPADGQAVGLPLLLGLAGGDVAPALHRHASVQNPKLSPV